MDREMYRRLRRKGESHLMAEMLACQQAPGSRFSDRAFLEGAATERVDPWLIKRHKQLTGKTPTGKYISQLADTPGDPKAWVHSVGDVMRRAEKENMRVRGAVEHSPKEREYPQDDRPYQVSERIVNERLADKLEADPSLKSKPEKVKEIRHEIKKKASGGRWKPK